MKKILLLAVICASTVVFAEDEKPNFEARKAKALEMVAKRQANLDTLKSCVTAAEDKDALKACREANKEANKSMRKGKRKEKI